MEKNSEIAFSLFIFFVGCEEYHEEKNDQKVGEGHHGDGDVAEFENGFVGAGWRST